MMVSRLVVACLLLLCHVVIVKSIFNKTKIKLREIHIGILDRGAKYRDVYNFALDHIEKKNEILPNTRIMPYYRDINSNPILISQRVFELLQRGVSAIICLAPSAITQQVANFANAKLVPVIAVTATDPLLANKEERPYLLRISPSDSQQSAAISDILSFFRWHHFSILTSYDPYGIHGIAGIQEAATERNWKINNIQHFSVPADVYKLNVSKELERVYKSESRIIVLNCGASAAGQVLRQAEKFGLTRDGYAWIVSDGVTGNFAYLSNRIMKLHSLRRNQRVWLTASSIPLAVTRLLKHIATCLITNDLSPGMSKNKVFEGYLDGLIGTMPATKDGTLYRSFTDGLSERYDLKRRDITPFARLAFDSVLVVSHALHAYFRENIAITEQNINVWDEPGVDFKDGPLLYEYLKKVEVEGASKMLSFDVDGQIKNAKYDIVNFDAVNGYFKEVGYWLPNTGIVLDTEEEVFFSGGTKRTPSYQIASLEGRHLTLGIDVDPPFIMHDESCGDENACYSGYCVSLVHELADMLDFTYEFVRPTDGTWGGLAQDGESWTGIFKDLLDRKIDIATVHMSINSIREEFIDFSVPFMQAGLTVVVKGEEETSDGYFFLSPFSADVLYAIGAAVFGVIIIVWVYNRISPSGLYWSKQFALMSCKCSMCRRRRREGRQFQRHKTCALKQLEAQEQVFAQLNMANSSWIVFASLLNQDPVISWPTSISGRIVLLFWWLVVMVVLAMYTANLAAFLTITKMTTGITKIEDLLNQDRYKWGTVKGTHPEVALANSVREDFKTIIRKQDAVLTTDEGFNRVMEQEYAFIYESPIFEFMKRKYCNLEKVGVGEFLSFDYAFGFPPDSPYIDVVNQALLKLQENSKLDTLWTALLSNTGQCPARPPTAQLTLQSLNGVFTTLAVGLVASVFALVGEYVYVTWCDVQGRTVGCPSSQRPKTMLEALKRRLRFLVHDLKHSFSPRSGIRSSCTETDNVLTDSESTRLKQNLDSNVDDKAPNGISTDHKNNEISESPDEVLKIDIDEEFEESDCESEVDMYSQTGDECTQCGH